jgi:hypothetical protein
MNYRNRHHTDERIFNYHFPWATIIIWGLFVLCLVACMVGAVNWEALIGLLQ